MLSNLVRLKISSLIAEIRSAILIVTVELTYDFGSFWGVIRISVLDRYVSGQISAR